MERERKIRIGGHLEKRKNIHKGGIFSSSLSCPSGMSSLMHLHSLARSLVSLPQLMKKVYPIQSETLGWGIRW